MAIVFTSEPVAKNTTTKNLDLIKAAECKLQEKSVEYTQNAEFEVLPDEGYDGMSKVNVSVDVVVPTVQASKAITITQNGPIEILPDSDYDVMEKVEATINVPTSSTYDITQAVVNLYRFTGTSVPANVVGWENLVDGRYKCQRSNIKEFTMQLPKLEDGRYMFTECADLTSFTIPSNFTFTGITDISYMFSTCSRLTATPEIDCHLVTDCTSFAANCPELVTVGALNGLGESLTKGGILYFAQSPNLSTDSLQTIAESIGTAVASYTSISLKSTAYDKLTNEQKSLIASKNWSINRVA